MKALETSLEELVDPSLRPALAGMPAFADELRRDLAGTRRLFGDLQYHLASALPPKAEVVSERRVIAGPGGPLELWIHTPARVEPSAGLVWCHGGGYVFGSGDDPIYAPQAAAAARCVVVSPGYRLAPEHRAPAALEDAYAALEWLDAHAAELGVDRRRLAVGGASAGGGLAASLALHARDRGGPALQYQWLLYPMLDDRHDNPAASRVTDPRVWNREVSLWAWASYREEGGASPAAAAARARDLSRLPPAYICVGGCDLFRDEAIAYASRLMAADVAVELYVAPGMFHGGETLVPRAEVSERLRQNYFAALARALSA